MSEVNNNLNVLVNGKTQLCPNNFHLASTSEYFLLGMANILSEEGVDFYPNKISQLSFSLDELKHASTAKYLVIHVPNEPVHLLKTLLYLDGLLRFVSSGNVIIISSIDKSWLKITLKKILRKKVVNFMFFYLSDKISVPMARLFFNDTIYSMVSLEDSDNLLQPEGYFSHSVYDGVFGLNYNELLALSSLYMEDLTNEEGVKKKKTKDFYGYRSSAIKKVRRDLPNINWNLPSPRYKSFTPKEELSNIESIFLRAVRDGNIKPYYQAIVDADGQPVGFEILCRWSHKGMILKPKDFLNEIKSPVVSNVLTFFLLDKAIDKVNEYQGDFFFSINITPSFWDSEEICNNLEIMRSKLYKSTWSKSIVLEASENTTFSSKNFHASELFRKIQDMGFKIYLDDCFSDSSTFFPVRTYPFDGYKIDMSIVNEFKESKSDLNLIKTLSIFCKLNDIFCIAEGVEDNNTFEKLINLGIDYFQGYRFCYPIDEDELLLFVSR